MMMIMMLMMMGLVELQPACWYTLRGASRVGREWNSDVDARVGCETGSVFRIRWSWRFGW